MLYSEVKELLQAGFTADEIRQIMNPQVNNSQNSQNNPQGGKVNDNEETPVNSSEKSVHSDQDPAGYQQIPADAKPENTNNDEKFNQLNETMTKILSAIQSANLQNNSFDSINKTDLNSEVDKIMGSIIRPERKEGGFNS